MTRTSGAARAVHAERGMGRLPLGDELAPRGGVGQGGEEICIAWEAAGWPFAVQFVVSFRASTDVSAARASRTVSTAPRGSVGMPERVAARGSLVAVPRQRRAAPEQEKRAKDERQPGQLLCAHTASPAGTSGR